MQTLQQQQVRQYRPPRPLLSPVRLPLDFAKMVAYRRAKRVKANTYMQDNINYFHDMKRAVEAENQFNEQHRLQDRLRVGGLPSHITRPIFESLLAGAKVPPKPKSQPKAPPTM